MSRKLTVAPSDEINTWLIFVDGLPVGHFNDKGDTLINLGVGEHKLSYKINGPGGSIKIDLEGHPPFVEPPEETWPLEREVPDGQTGATDAVYFVIEQ